MEMALDIVIIILIAVMIGYAVALNIRLKTFRNAQNEMTGLISQLNDAITRAQSSVEQLKQAALAEEGRLDSLTQKARLVADELEIITQSGSNLADRIERGLLPDPAGAREDDMTSPVEDREDAAGDDGAAVDFSEEEREMLETLKRTR